MKPDNTTNSTFSEIETKKLKRLYNAHRTIQTLCVLWIIGSIFLAIAIVHALFSTENTGMEKIVGFAIFTPILGLNIATIIGCYKRTSWGRVCGIILCIIALIGIPIGTLIGILGLVVFIRSRELFGVDRFNPDELVAEYKQRRKKKV